MRTPTPLVPVPMKITPKDGSVSLAANTQIEAPDALRPPAERLRDTLRPATGLPLPTLTTARGSRIALGLVDRIAPCGDDAYRLAPAAERSATTAPSPAALA